jgi:PhzF family phenazine biosynthesis protein
MTPSDRRMILRARMFQVDAFTTNRFCGNPAAVMLLEEFLADDMLQTIAAENNLAETAFLVRDGDDYKLRWFTPALEVPLCGHATLASAAVVMERLEPQRTSVIFHSASGPLHVKRAGAGYRMDFPARPSERIETPENLSSALGAIPFETYLNSFNYLAIFDDARTVRGLVPDMAAIAKMDRLGVIVTAPGDGEYDFVSRYFAPAKGIPEDPATGAAHCMLAPYWANRLGKTEFHVFQASRRGGEIECRLAGDRVELQGSCVFYLEGHATVSG